MELDLDAICDAFHMVFQIVFWIFTSKPISDGISDAFWIFGLKIKKKKKLGRVHGTPWNHFVLNLYVITYLSVAIFGLVFFFWV